MRTASRRVSGGQVVPYTSYRSFAAAGSLAVKDRPLIHGLIEVDVTEPRAVLREHHLRTGETLSFTAFVTACVATAVDENKALQAFRYGHDHLFLFDDIDVCTRIEREVDGERIVFPYVIRAAHRKTVNELHDEIRAAQGADLHPFIARFGWLPRVLQKPFVRAFLAVGASRPHVLKETMGTVGVTSVGMFGSGAGWGIPAASPTTLMVTVGGIAEKQVMVGGRVTVREFLSLTISVDHDLVDGAPATRFTQRLKQLLESGHGLSAATGQPIRSEREATAR
jgi:pyruvate/2-oxoglutarate dehydrogenase complex dihydrolipoamide acyltransferase (E2) component